MRWFMFCLVLIFVGLVIPVSREGLAADFRVYSVYRGINLGGTEESPQKDIFVNMGTEHGVREGMLLQVFRKTATYDLRSDRLYRDVVFPIALVKVIHVEPGASIARLEKMLPLSSTPSISPRTIMVGDIVSLH